MAGILKSQWDTTVNLNNVRYTTWAFPTTTGNSFYSLLLLLLIY